MRGPPSAAERRGNGVTLSSGELQRLHVERLVGLVAGVDAAVEVDGDAAGGAREGDPDPRPGHGPPQAPGAPNAKRAAVPGRRVTASGLPAPSGAERTGYGRPCASSSRTSG